MAVDAVEALAALPLSERLVGSTRLVCRVEWAWGPTNDRGDEMRLAGTADRWLLLLCYREEISGEAEKRVVAAIAKARTTAREAARAALTAFWAIEKSAVELSEPSRIVAGKVLTEGELRLIAEEVWQEDN